ncbi:MAG: hypothetical protein Q9175_007666, partial [Cornicularia normoerica]
MASQRQTGTDRSATALGLGYRQWTRKDLLVILSHYGVRFVAGDTNKMLIDSLNQLAAQRGLTREDRLTIIKAHNAGLRLPPRKPLVRALVAPSTIAQTATTPPATATAHRAEYSSGASDGSDVEMSDDEPAEELPSLSEEERDLREYTATMISPQSSGQRRTLGPRSAAIPLANRSIPTSRLAALNCPVTRNLQAVPRGSATARNRGSSNLRRSGPAAAIRAAPTTSPRVRGVARPRVAALSTQVTSGPSTLQTTQAVNSDLRYLVDTRRAFASHVCLPQSLRNLTPMSGLALAVLSLTVESFLSIVISKHLQTPRSLR